MLLVLLICFKNVHKLIIYYEYPKYTSRLCGNIYWQQKTTLALCSATRTLTTMREHAYKHKHTNTK